MSDKYVTGHKPKQSFQELVAEANSNSFFVKDHDPKPPKRRRNRKRERIEAAASTFSQDQLELLLQLLKGRAVQLQVRGEPYVAIKHPDGWSIRALHAGATERFVDAELKECSCPQSTMHRKRCKHIEALEALK